MLRTPMDVRVVVVVAQVPRLIGRDRPPAPPTLRPAGPHLELPPLPQLLVMRPVAVLARPGAATHRSPGPSGEGGEISKVIGGKCATAGLDLDGARLSVEQQLVPTRGGVSFGPPKSSRSRRTVALDPETVEALRRHRETQLLERDFAADAYQDGDLVFADELGRPIHPQRLTQWFAEHRKAAGIPNGTLHTLRHTAATLALTAGVPVHIVAARLGDAPTEVLKTYAHLLPQSDELAAERIAAALTAR
jgi:hypothetical protein